SFAFGSRSHSPLRVVDARRTGVSHRRRPGHRLRARNRRGKRALVQRAGFALPAPPASPEELVARAHALVGAELGALAGSPGIDPRGTAVRTKGMPGGILERALGATGGGAKVHDFPHLGIELKTIPVDARGMPIESTYVCTLSLADAEEQEW